MLKKNLRENELGLYGWINYTYTQSKYKSGLPTEAGLYGDVRNLVGDPYGDRWLNYDYEQVHSMKMVAGYGFQSRRFRGRHTISAKFQYYSSLPYTPIVGPTDTAITSILPQQARNAMFRSTVKPNTAHFNDDHQLDLRYGYQVNIPGGM